MYIKKPIFNINHNLMLLPNHLYKNDKFHSSELIEEIAQYDEKQSEIKSEDDAIRRVKGYKKTSLNSSVHIFEEFLRKLETSWKGKRIEISGEL